MHKEPKDLSVCEGEECDMGEVGVCILCVCVSNIGTTGRVRT
jgi:hypothetical protein